MKLFLIRILFSGLCLGLFSQVSQAGEASFLMCHEQIDGTTGERVSNEIWDFTPDANHRPRNMAIIERLRTQGVCKPIPIDITRTKAEDDEIQITEVENKSGKYQDVGTTTITFDSDEEAAAMANMIISGKIKSVVFLDGTIEDRDSVTGFYGMHVAPAPDEPYDYSVDASQVAVFY